MLLLLLRALSLMFMRILYTESLIHIDSINAFFKSMQEWLDGTLLLSIDAAIPLFGVIQLDLPASTYAFFLVPKIAWSKDQV